MRLKKVTGFILATCLAALGGGVVQADPWADTVVRYVEGAGVENDFVTGNPFNDPLAVLGQPTRITSPDSFPSPVTPLNAPFRSTELASIGRGGELVVQFHEPVLDEAANPFGVDLLIFGNAFFTGDFFGNPAATATGVASEGGVIEVSADGVSFFAVPGDADGLYPANGYADLRDPFATAPGLVPADFTRPVNPAFDPVGKTYPEILAGYAGSGGGVGVDIGPTGLSSISFVRISNPASAAGIPEIDAFADVAAVPEPAIATILTPAVLIAWQSRIRRYRRT